MAIWNGGAPASTGAWNFSGGGTGTFTAGSDFLPASQTFGMRWAGMPIPKGAVITSAALVLSGIPAAGTVGAHQVDNAPALANGQQTTAHTPTGSIPSGAGSKTVYVTAAIQALVDRAGWASGNAVVLRAQSTGGSVLTVSGLALTVDYVVSTAFIREVTDTAGAGDTVTVEVGYAREALDTAGVSDDAVAVIPVTRDSTDSAGATDSATVTLVPGTSRPVTDTAGAVDTVTVEYHPAVYRMPVDSAAAADQVAVVLIAFEPPPPPWQDVLTDPEYLEATRSLHQTRSFRADIINPDGVPIGSVPISGGQVECDGDRSYRWHAGMVIADPAWKPIQETDKLHPVSRHSIQLWSRLLLPRSQRWVEIPCGRVFPEDGGNSEDAEAPPLEFDITAVSALGTIRAYLQPVDLSGMRGHTAIETILAAVAPAHPRDLTPTMHCLPPEYVVGEPHGGDPVADMHAIAASIGMVLYEDAVGVIRLDPVPDATPDYDWSTGVVQRIDVEDTSRSELVNSLLVRSGSHDIDPPVFAVAQITDPDDPLNVGHGFYYPAPPLVSDSVTTTGQCQLVADTELVRRRELRQDLSVVIPPHTHLQPGEVAILDRPAVGVVGTRRVTGWVMSLDTTALQAVLMRGAVNG